MDVALYLCCSFEVKCLSPPQRLPLGIPFKISIIDKNRKRAGDDGKRETASLLSSPFPSRPHTFFFFLPSLPTTQKPPHNTKRPLRRREGEMLLFCFKYQIYYYLCITDGFPSFFTHGCNFLFFD